MFQDDSDDDDPFEGFYDNEVEQNAKCTANILSTGPERTILDTDSEFSDISETESVIETDYDSPGH